MSCAHVPALLNTPFVVRFQEMVQNCERGGSAGRPRINKDCRTPLVRQFHCFVHRYETLQACYRSSETKGIPLIKCRYRTLAFPTAILMAVGLLPAESCVHHSCFHFARIKQIAFGKAEILTSEPFDCASCSISSAMLNGNDSADTNMIPR